MNTIKHKIEVIKPNLNVPKPKNNTIKHLNYFPFDKRVFDLSKMFKDNLNEEYTNVIKVNVYEDVATHYEDNDVRKNHPIFYGIYKLAPMRLYIGNIPKSNQKEIKIKLEKLKENPFLEQVFELVILAPLNNFAEENNIMAIDPIAFALFRKNQKTFLITLSQWI